MRKLLLFSLFLVTCSLWSQKQIVWFDTGFKVQYGAGGFYSKAIEDLPKVSHEVGLGTGLGYGFKLGFNKNYSGLSLEAFFNKGEQKYENLNSGEGNFSYKFKSLDIYPLFRNAKNLGYFEIGPKVSFLKKMDLISGSQVTNQIDKFNKTNFAGVLGFGANIMGNDGRFSGILGLRFEYGFTDIVKKDLNIAGAGTRSGTNPYFAGLVFELNWGIGYFGRAQCGARSKFIMF